MEVEVWQGGGGGVGEWWRWWWAGWGWHQVGGGRGWVGGMWDVEEGCGVSYGEGYSVASACLHPSVEKSGDHEENNLPRGRKGSWRD